MPKRTHKCQTKAILVEHLLTFITYRISYTISDQGFKNGMFLSKSGGGFFYKNRPNDCIVYKA